MQIVAVSEFNQPAVFSKSRNVRNVAIKSHEKIPPETLQKAHIEPPVITLDGTLIFAQTGWEPPPVVPGYQRKSSDLTSDDAWVLAPLEPICKHLELKVAERGSCGYHRIARKCKLVQSFIGQRTCTKCPKKEV